MTKSPSEPRAAERVAIRIDALKRLAGPDAEALAKSLAEWCYEDAARIARRANDQGRSANTAAIWIMERSKEVLGDD